MTKQSQSEFFARADVRAQQEIQKRNRYGSKAHRDAYNELVRLAKAIGAEKYFGSYYH